MSRRNALRSKRRKAGLDHPLADALRELRDAPWPRPGSYKDGCGLSMDMALELQARTVLLPATATSARLQTRLVPRGQFKGHDKWWKP